MKYDGKELRARQYEDDIRLKRAIIDAIESGQFKMTDNSGMSSEELNQRVVFMCKMEIAELEGRRDALQALP